MANIILIEDDPSVAILIGDILLMKGYNVCTFSRGNDFLGTIPEQCPTIVISDYQLPDLSVQELFQAIQARYAPETPRFIIISARSKAEVDLPIFEKFKPIFIEKPFLIREFIKSVEEICS
jgi:DNA-binding response OmpR family regulator